jgi:hypothetical protein
MQQEFSTLQAFVMSFYSRRLYQDIYLRWQHSGLFYTLKFSIGLAVLAVVLTLFAISRVSMDTPFRDFSTWLLGHTPAGQEDSINRAFSLIYNLPHLKYENGELKTDPATPMVVTDTKSHLALMTINTSDTPSPIPSRHNTPYVTVTRDHLKIDDQRLAFSSIASDTIIQNFLTILNHFPVLQLSQGRLVYTGQDPLIITASNSTDPLFIIDTGSKPVSLDEKSTAVALLTADSVAFKYPFGLTSTIVQLRWDQLSAESLYQGLKHTFSLLRYIIAFGLILMIAFVIFLLFLIQIAIVFIYSTLGFYGTKLIAPALAEKLSFHHYVQLYSVALTPVFILCFIFPPVRLTLLLLYLLLAAGYAYFATSSVLHERNTAHY